jgi:phosphoribosylformylglycinamidine synthase
MAQACSVLNIPIISGNVSLYNETKGQAVYPTPVVGMLGLIEDIEARCGIKFKHEGDIVFLIGGSHQGEEDLSGSEYLEIICGKVAGKPGVDLQLEKRVQGCCLEAIKRGIINSAHDCSDGGLAIALSECCIAGGIGFKGKMEVEKRLDAALFGEGQSRIVVSMEPEEEKILELYLIASEHQIMPQRLGVVGGDCFIIEGLVDLQLKEVEKAWREGLEQALGGTYG